MIIEIGENLSSAICVFSFFFMIAMVAWAIGMSVRAK